MTDKTLTPDQIFGLLSRLLDGDTHALAELTPAQHQQVRLTVHMVYRRLMHEQGLQLAADEQSPTRWSDRFVQWFVDHWLIVIVIGLACGFIAGYITP